MYITWSLYQQLQEGIISEYRSPQISFCAFEPPKQTSTSPPNQPKNSNSTKTQTTNTPHKKPCAPGPPSFSRTPPARAASQPPRSPSASTAADATAPPRTATTSGSSSSGTSRRRAAPRPPAAAPTCGPTWVPAPAGVRRRLLLLPDARGAGGTIEQFTTGRDDGSPV
ncbi:hypothetical protein QBC39DRAFT_380029 [Podospora conica]|nr:hypothetical protein QBC39DRAFT_380029 [Schizothecium conicum]